MTSFRKFIFRQCWMLLIPAALFAQTPAQYALADANDYFSAGRYWDAFFAYRDIARTPEFSNNYEVTSQIKNSSKALFYKRKFENYRAFRQYELAKSNLRELITLNPQDPSKGELPRVTLQQAEDLMRFAHRQRSDVETANMLQKSIRLFHQAMAEGLKDESINTAIRMAEMSLKKTGVEPTVQPTTTYGIINDTQRIDTPQRIERDREIKIIKEQ